MAYFYGVYLANSAASAALDLLRFLAEPQDIRVSHITLRGPYPKKLSADWLDKQNQESRFDWKVRLTTPGQFVSKDQCTVFIGVDLLSLRGLWHKPDFPRGLPHLTVYDGRDQNVGEYLFKLLSAYNWNYRVPVSRMRLIQRKHNVDEVLLPSFVAFYQTFEKYVGDPDKISSMRALQPLERLRIAKRVLDASFRQSLSPKKSG